MATNGLICKAIVIPLNKVGVVEVLLPFDTEPDEDSLEDEVTDGPGCEGHQDPQQGIPSGIEERITHSE